MNATIRTLNELFDQLGLPSGEDAIGAFIREHRPLPEEVSLEKAPWWTPAQAGFLKEAFRADSDWVMAVDELNVMLRPEQKST
ncbi:MAG: DUF2789 domain-containing protein [Candidatus Competibacter sp.]|nr:DUF2789 domain-containing protein [Candidatus Competibacter sp.]